MDVDQPLPQVGIRGEWPGGVFEQLSPGPGDRRFGQVILPRRHLGSGQSGIGIVSVHQAGDEGREWHAVRRSFDGPLILGGQLTIKSREATG